MDQHLSRYPIKPHGKGFLLLDRDGMPISYHRTKTGALRKRRDIIEQETKNDHA